MISSLCSNIREDILCTNCSIINGAVYSIVFGSTECRQCSNWCLWTIILYSVTDPFLTNMLQTLRFTLTAGTLFVFYAQTVKLYIMAVWIVLFLSCFINVIWFAWIYVKYKLKLMLFNFECVHYFVKKCFTYICHFL